MLKELNLQNLVNANVKDVHEIVRNSLLTKLVNDLNGMNLRGEKKRVRPEDIDQPELTLATRTRTDDIDLPELTHTTRMQTDDIDLPESSLTTRMQEDDMNDHEPSRKKQKLGTAEILFGNWKGRDPEAGFKIPESPPTRRGNTLEHHIETEAGESITLSIPATKGPMDNVHDPELEEFMKNPDEKIDLREWLQRGAVPASVENALKYHEIGGFYGLCKLAFKIMFAHRDGYIRNFFPYMYSSNSDGRILGFWIKGPALKYYLNEYEIFCEFADALKK